jgi:hypothetical protein
MAYTVYNCDTMTGGAARSLDILSVGALTTGDRAIVLATAAAYFFKYNSTGTAAEQAATAPRVVRPDDYSSAGNWEEYVPGTTASSVLVQVKHASVSSVVSGTTILPIDDTIPQNNEGVEAITCAITPKSASNILLIIANMNFHYSSGNSAKGAIALFQDSTANALAACMISARMDLSYAPATTLVHKMTAETTGETTFKIRFGASVAGTSCLNVNSLSSSRVFGGVSSSTLTIFEYAQ